MTVQPISYAGIAIRQLVKEHILPQQITAATVASFAEKGYEIALIHISARIVEAQRKNLLIQTNAARAGDKEKEEAAIIRYDTLRQILLDIRAMAQ